MSRDIDIEWHAGRGGTEHDLRPSSRRSVQTHSAIVHEPLARLYEALPLAELDAKARRFWRRVFRLVRIPGGRYLLLAMARRNAHAALIPRSASQESALILSTRVPYGPARGYAELRRSSTLAWP